LDADFAGCQVERKSTLGTCQFLGSSLVSLSSRKQSSVTQSTTKAEYVAAASCCYQLLWIRYKLIDFIEECTHVPLTSDSMSAISAGARYHWQVNFCMFVRLIRMVGLKVTGVILV
jgi:hypothetical protein